MNIQYRIFQAFRIEDSLYVVEYLVNARKKMKKEWSAVAFERRSMKIFIYMKGVGLFLAAISFTLYPFFP